MSDPNSRRPRWWGTYEVPHGTVRCWQIGPMTLWIQRYENEWRVATAVDEAGEERLPDAAGLLPGAESSEHGQPGGPPDLMELPTLNRFAVSSEAEAATLTPVLADRPVVTSPIKPVYIPAGQQATVFVGTPLWLRIAAGALPVHLIEFPILRPSDTWFGSTPADGELCYASRTSCRLRLGEVPLRSHRAFTAVRVKNRSASPFLLERMNLPVIYLPLFGSDDGALWTRDVTFDYVEGQAFAPLQYDGDTPAHAADPQQISPARTESSGNLVTRVFSSLFN